MRKFLILFVLFPILSAAKFYRATIALNDGNLKNGFVELPEYPDDKNLKFKSDEKAKTEKLSIDLVKGFEITNDKNEVVKYVTLFLANPKPFTNDKFKLEEKKSWVKVVRDGNINIYATTSVYSPMAGTGGFSMLYVQKENDKYAYYFANADIKNLKHDYTMNGFQVTKKYLNTIFGTECPKFMEIFNKEDYKNEGYDYIVDLYEQNCGKN